METTIICVTAAHEGESSHKQTFPDSVSLRVLKSVPAGEGKCHFGNHNAFCKK